MAASTPTCGASTWNFEPYYYAYPDANLPHGASKASYFELINQFTQAFGPLSVQRHLGLFARVQPGRRHRQLSGRQRHLHHHRLAERQRQCRPSVGAGGEVCRLQRLYLWRYRRHRDLEGLRAGSALYRHRSQQGHLRHFYMATKNACAGNFVATLTYNFTLFP